MAKWQIGIVLVFCAVYCFLVAITGHATWVITGVILAVLLMSYALLNWAITRRALSRHDGNREEAMADDEDSIPASHLIPDDDGPTGDTPEVHSELNVHDFPLTNPARRTVMELAGSAQGTTGGHEYGAAGGAARPGEDRTAERSGEPEQRSAAVTPNA